VVVVFGAVVVVVGAAVVEVVGAAVVELVLEVVPAIFDWDAVMLPEAFEPR
jgi:hypothetical protein